MQNAVCKKYIWIICKDFITVYCKWQCICIIMLSHYNDAIMSSMASKITSLMIVYSTVYSRADQRKHQRTASLAFVWRIHRWPVNSPHKCPATRKMFPFNDFIMAQRFHLFCRGFSTYGFNRVILGMGSANGRRCFYVTPSLIGRAHTQNDPCWRRSNHTWPPWIEYYMNQQRITQRIKQLQQRSQSEPGVAVQLHVIMLYSINQVYLIMVFECKPFGLSLHSRWFLFKAMGAYM